MTLDTKEYLKRRIHSIYLDILEIESSDDGSNEYDKKVLAITEPFDIFRLDVLQTFKDKPGISPLSTFNYENIYEKYGSRALVQRLKSMIREIADVLNVDLTKNSVAEKDSNHGANGPNQTINFHPVISTNAQQSQTSVNQISFDVVLHELNKLSMDDEQKTNLLKLTNEFEDERKSSNPNTSKLKSLFKKIATISVQAGSILLQYATSMGLLEHLFGG